MRCAFGIGTLLVSVCLSNPSFAEDCTAALILSTYDKLEASKSDWRMANHVDSSTYNELKRNVGVDGAIYGVPVGGSYDDFKKNISQFKTSNTQSLSKEQFTNISWTGLSPESSDAYKTCIRAQSKGVILVPDKATDTDISFKIVYAVVGGSPNPLPIAWRGAAARASQSELPNSLAAGDTIIIVDRPEKTSTLALNGEDNTGFADSVVLTPLPPEIPIEERYPNRCDVSDSQDAKQVVRGQSAKWVCGRVRAGTYQATLSVVPGSNRPIRLSWHANLILKGPSGEEQTINLATSSGAVIDAGVDAQIGTSFESIGNIVDVKTPGTISIFEIGVDSTRWHMDFEHESDDVVLMPAQVKIKLEPIN